MWSQCSNSPFWSATPIVWAFEPERSQHKLCGGSDLQRHQNKPVTATRQLPLPFHLSKRGVTAGMADCLCFMSNSAVISVSMKCSSAKKVCHKNLKVKIFEGKAIRACQGRVYSYKSEMEKKRRNKLGWYSWRHRICRQGFSCSLKMWRRCFWNLVVWTRLCLPQNDKERQSEWRRRTPSSGKLDFNWLFVFHQSQRRQYLWVWSFCIAPKKQECLSKSDMQCIGFFSSSRRLFCTFYWGTFCFVSHQGQTESSNRCEEQLQIHHHTAEHQSYLLQH